MWKKRPLPAGAKKFSEQPGSKKVFSGVRFDIYQWPQKQFDGSTATYEIAKRNDSVVIVPVIGEEVVIVKERQPHWDEDGYTLIAGMVNSDEDLASAAQRELEEETGLIFKNYHLVQIEPPVPGIELFVYTFVASNFVGEKQKKLDPGEKNEVVKVSFKNLIKMTREKKFLYRPQLVEEHLVQDKIETLFDLLKNPAKYELK